MEVRDVVQLNRPSFWYTTANHTIDWMQSRVAKECIIGFLAYRQGEINVHIFYTQIILITYYII